MKFTVVDVETANADLASICQVGVAQFLDGSLARSWGSLVDPEDFFDGYNSAVHGIREADVAGAPTFPQVLPELLNFLDGQVAVSHTPFDQLALDRACARYALQGPAPRWLDSARVVRRTWLDRARSGYGLNDIATALGISYRPHDAVEDARAAGEVLLRAFNESGIGLDDWIERAQRPIGAGSTGGITRQGNDEGPLVGEVVVFTGALAIPRREAADAAAHAGCAVAASVNKRTTLLVVGDQDIRRLSGHEKSAKHRKAEDLKAKGQRIRILRESDFAMLVAVERA